MAPQSQSLGWIWPKDPRPGNPSTWPRHWRFLDVFTNKGPDIYVGKISNKPSNKPPKSQSRSSSPRSNSTRSSDSRSSSSCSFYTSESEPIPPKSPRKTNWDRWNTQSPPAKKSQAQVPWAKRKSNERYDFRQRKYTVPDLGTWSRVEYCTLRGKEGWIRLGKEKHCVPRRYWDQNGKEYPANYWHDIIYGEHDDDIQE